MLRDSLVGLIEPIENSAGLPGSRAAGLMQKERVYRTIDPPCLEYSRPARVGIYISGKRLLSVSS